MLGFAKKISDSVVYIKSIFHISLVDIIAS